MDWKRTITKNCHSEIITPGGHAFGLIRAIREIRGSAFLSRLNLVQHEPVKRVSDVTKRSAVCRLGFFVSFLYFVVPLSSHILWSYTMSESAKVTSVEAVSRFHAAVRVFQDEAENGLLALDQQVAKVLARYDYDLPHYWKEQVRRSFDEVDRARAAYETCRMRTVAGHRPSCHEEKEALALAKRRLEFSQQQVEVVGRWAVKLHRQIDEFRAQTGRFRQYLEGDVEKTAALLQRTLSSLETYLDQPVQSENSPQATEPSQEES